MCLVHDDEPNAARDGETVAMNGEELGRGEEIIDFASDKLVKQAVANSRWGLSRKHADARAEFGER